MLLLSYKEYEFYCRFEGTGPTKTGYIWYIRDMVSIWFSDRYNRFLCWRTGHQLEDQGHANPESGCIHMICKRCGYDYGVNWLY